MRRLKYKLDRKWLESIYIPFIRPLLEYGDTIWDTCTQYEKVELDKIQNEAARIATGAAKLLLLNDLYKERGWEPLSKRQSNHKLTLLYKMINHLTPSICLSLYQYKLVLLLDTIYEMHITIKQYEQEQINTGIPSYHQLYISGTIYH